MEERGFNMYRIPIYSTNRDLSLKAISSLWISDNLGASKAYSRAGNEASIRHGKQAIGRGYTDGTGDG